MCSNRLCFAFPVAVVVFLFCRNVAWNGFLHQFQMVGTRSGLSKCGARLEALMRGPT